MTPKEKARELVLKYLKLQEKDSYNWFNKNLAKQCALIAVDELIKDNLHNENIVNGGLNAEYWQEVKIEIEKL